MQKRKKGNAGISCYGQAWNEKNSTTDHLTHTKNNHQTVAIALPVELATIHLVTPDTQQETILHVWMTALQFIYKC